MIIVVTLSVCSTMDWKLSGVKTTSAFQE
jgi:hypothetical protein